MKIIKKSRKSFLIATLLILGLSFYLLVSASPLLSKPLINSLGFPVGTLTTWLGLVALPLTFYLSHKSIRIPQTSIEKIISWGFISLILLGLGWGLISYFLAANWGFNFNVQENFRGSVEAGNIFWNFTYFLVAAPLVLIILKLVATLLIKKKNAE